LTRLAALLLAAAPLAAHDLYLKPARMVVRGGEKIRVEYHNGDAFPKSETTVVLARLRDARRIAASGEAPFEGVRNEGKTTVASVAAPGRGHFHLISRTEPNFIELPPDSFEKYLAHEGLGWVIEWRRKNGESNKPGREIYSKYVKSLLVAEAGDGSFVTPAGLTVEFVPLDDPYTAAAGPAIRVRLDFRGRPAAGHEVELQSLVSGKASRQALGKTGADGVVRVPLAGAGFYKLHAIVMERPEDRSRADWESFWATLTFGTGPP
jgi:uncharacterized GH25 family protein